MCVSLYVHWLQLPLLKFFSFFNTRCIYLRFILFLFLANEISREDWARKLEKEHNETFDVFQVIQYTLVSLCIYLYFRSIVSLFLVNEMGREDWTRKLKKKKHSKTKYVNATHFFLLRFLSFSSYCSIFFSLLLTVCLCFSSLSPCFALGYIHSLHYPNMTKIWTLSLLLFALVLFW